MRAIIIYVFLLFSGSSYAQKTLSELLKIHNDNGVPYISSEALAMEKAEVILLDSRELKEYKVSHLKGAYFVGYDHFNIDSFQKTFPDKDKKIVVYCSLGIRSETIGERLKKVGYTKVYNLYGGIFEWKNKNFIVVDSKEQPTDKVHTFNKDWSKWLKKGVKIYDKSLENKKE